MAFLSYSEQLRDPRWQEVKGRVLARADHRCQLCGDNRRTLHAHHSYYVPGRMAWDYPLRSLVCLCFLCHEAVHAFLKLRRAWRPGRQPAGQGAPFARGADGEPVTAARAKSYLVQMRESLTGGDKV